MLAPPASPELATEEVATHLSDAEQGATGICLF